MFGFKMPQMGGEGSSWSKMGDQQRLMALGSALQGDQAGLEAVLAQIGGGQEAPVMSADGQDISAAFGSGGGGMGGGADIFAALGGGKPEKQEQAPAPFAFPMMRRFGFGGL